MNVVVTDHAIYRWLERVMGFDMMQARAELARLGATEADDVTVLCHIEIRDGIDLGKVRDAMLTPTVLAAARARAASVTEDGVTFRFRHSTGKPYITTVGLGAFLPGSNSTGAFNKGPFKRNYCKSEPWRKIKGGKRKEFFRAASKRGAML